MTHAAVYSGHGYYCWRCRQSWDQGETPLECARRPGWIGTQLTDLAQTLREIDRPIKTPVDTL